MALKVINKINGKLKFLYQKNSFLTPRLQRMLCNALIQPHFDYACSMWYHNLNAKLKKTLQIMQNKCIRFCPKLDKMHHISEEDFKTINWRPVDQRVQQSLNVTVFKYINKTCPYYCLCLGATVKIRLFCLFCVIPAIVFFPLHQENVAIHFLYQVQLLWFIHLFIFLFIFNFLFFFF